MITKKTQLENVPLWHQFITQFSLTPVQVDQFKRYYDLLSTYNDLFNLTTIIQPHDVIAYHFQDSLEVSRFYNVTSTTTIADVGSGAGFPGIPLKILFPHVSVTLIEVTQKKIDFLLTVIEQLGLTNISVYDLDWRTFLRKTTLPVELFVSRASLHTDELVRIFKPTCPYRKSTLIYWASKEWQLGESEKIFFEKETSYKIEHKTRRLIFFKSN